MDSNLKSKTVSFIVVLVMYAIASVTLTAINFSYINSDTYDFVDVTNNWQTGAIMQITVANACPPGYEEAFNYTWPGTETGCWCGSISTFMRVLYSITSDLYTGTCSYNKTRAGCTNIYPNPPVVMDVWAQNNYGNMKVCVQRSQETWLQVAQQSEGNCSNTTLKCGFSAENTFCTSESLCPINNVIISNLSLPAQSDVLANCTVQNNCTVLSQTPSIVKILQYQRGDTFDALPTAQMRLNEYSMCLDSTENDITPGRTDFKLLNSVRSTCYSEGASLWNWTDSMTEAQLFALNGLTTVINNLQAYGYYSDDENGNDYEYSVFSRSYIPWSIDCRGSMSNLVDNSSTIKTLRVLQLILLIFTGIASICLGIILPLILWQLRFGGEPSLKRFAKGFNHVVKIPQLGLQIAVLVISSNTKGFFQQIVTGNCSTPVVMQTLVNLADDLQKTFVFNIINISMLVFIMFAGILYFFEGIYRRQADTDSYFEAPKKFDDCPKEKLYASSKGCDDCPKEEVCASSDFPQYSNTDDVPPYPNQQQAGYYAPPQEDYNQYASIQDDYPNQKYN